MAIRDLTGRNTPGNSRFVFGPDCCFRSLIKPARRWGVAYLDFKSQEFFVAAVLSGDQRMIDDYLQDDPYLILGKAAGLIPPDGTKKSHKTERDFCKICVLATLYGQGEYGLAIQLNVAPIVARDLQKTFWRRYPTCAAWRENYVWSAIARGYVETVFGWRAREGDNPKSPIADERYPKTLTLDEARALSPAPAFSTELRGGAGTPPAVGHSCSGGMGHNRGAAFRPGTSKSAATKARSERQYLSSGSAWPSV